MPAKKTASKSVVLKSICQDLKIEPKAARRALRKAGLSFHTPKERWVIPGSALAKVKSVLKPAAAG